MDLWNGAEGGAEGAGKGAGEHDETKLGSKGGDLHNRGGVYALKG